MWEIAKIAKSVHFHFQEVEVVSNNRSAFFKLVVLSILPQFKSLIDVLLFYCA